MSQLTITLDDDLLQAAQVYAHQRGQELDALVAGLLRATVQPAASEPVVPALTSKERLAIVHKLAGSLKAPANFDYKKELEEGLREKYGLRDTTSWTRTCCSISCSCAMALGRRPSSFLKL